MDFFNRFGEDRRQKAGEVLRFGIVGLVATLIQYLVYRLLAALFSEVLVHGNSRLWATVAMTVGYGVSFVFNFLASTRFTFRVKASVGRGAGFLFSHVINYFLQMVTLNFFLWLGLSRSWAPVPMFCICVPVNFLLVRFFLTKKS